MRKFKCAACGHEFEVPHGTGGTGRDMKCPECGGLLHRADAGGPPEGCGPAPGLAGRGRGQRASQKSKKQ